MILLDTDHITLLQYAEGPRYERLMKRLDQLTASEPLAIPIIAVEEQMRGWMAVLAKERLTRRQIAAYRELALLFVFFGSYSIAEFDAPAADQFDALRIQKLRIGTMDLKIAAIALANQALLLSANLRDFGRVPGLRVESWAD